jgi:hypothetical protein
MENLAETFCPYPLPCTGDVFMAQRVKCALQWPAVYLSFCGISTLFSVIYKSVPAIPKIGNVHIYSPFFNSVFKLHSSLYIPVRALLSVPSVKNYGTPINLPT